MAEPLGEALETSQPGHRDFEAAPLTLRRTSTSARQHRWRGSRPQTVGSLVVYPEGVLALFQIQNTFLMIATLVVFVIQAWAFVDAVSHRPEAFVAADKMTKPTWLIILGIALVAHLLIWNPVNFLNLIGAVAAIVYIVDARPALRAVTGR